MPILGNMPIYLGIRKTQKQDFLQKKSNVLNYFTCPVVVKHVEHAGFDHITLSRKQKDNYGDMAVPQIFDTNNMC